MSESPPNPRRRGRPTKRTAEFDRTKALTYYLCGWSVARIAAALGVRRAIVDDHLRGVAGVGGRRRLDAERFRSAWNIAPTAAAAAKALGVSVHAAQRQAFYLGNRGVKLKAMPRRPKPRRKGERIETLLRKGLLPKEIARQIGVSCGYVVAVRGRLMPSGIVRRRWTAAEDAMLAMHPAAAVATRTGRTVAAVRVRRQRLSRDDRVAAAG